MNSETPNSYCVLSINIYSYWYMLPICILFPSLSGPSRMNVDERGVKLVKLPTLVNNLQNRF